jgi:hypothetical protein
LGHGKQYTLPAWGEHTLLPKPKSRAKLPEP